jgi:hypothetical protein
MELEVQFGTLNLVVVPCVQQMTLVSWEAEQVCTVVCEHWGMSAQR